MAELKLNKSQERENFGAFIHEGLFLKEVEEIKATIGVPDVSSVNGQTGVVVLGASDIEVSKGKTIEDALGETATKASVDTLTTEVNNKAEKSSVDAVDAKLANYVLTTALAATLADYLKTADLADAPAFKALEARVAKLENPTS